MDGTARDVAPHRHVVAGLLVHTPRPFPGLPVQGFHDGEVVVRIVDDPNPQSDGWRDVPIDSPVRLRLRIDGGEIEAASADTSLDELAVAVRSSIPFAAALQSKVTLHAAGVFLAGGTAAIVGASGAGKSTLAEAMRDEGLAVVADDLLPCRLKIGRVAVPSPPDASGNHGMAKLTGVYFLARESDLDRPVLRRLGGRGCFKRLVRHGFGEIAVAAAWSAQVDVYHRIADQLPAFEMNIPDDLGRLAEVARWFEAVGRQGPE